MNAIMTDFDFKHGNEPLPERWAGLAEFDRALAEDRLMTYRFKKTWADPVSRMLTIAVCIIILAGFAFLMGVSVLG